MHVYFSGIGGTAIGPLALIAYKAGLTVSGSDKQHNLYIDSLKKYGIDAIHIGQGYEEIAAVHTRRPIDWYVYTSALPMEQPDAPELRFCKEHGIKATKRDEFLNFLLTDKKLKLIAIAGTHGKTTTTAMTIWLMQQLGIPISYSVGAKMSFGDMGEFDPASEYFVYEADEFDHNFLAFHPHMSLITGLDWDHPDIYPTREDYIKAFSTFLGQCEQTVLWQEDAKQLGVKETQRQTILPDDTQLLADIHLAGLVNRRDALLVAVAIEKLTGKPKEELLGHLNSFPGIGRRFEQIVPNVYSDYAHTPAKIRGALQLAQEVANNNNVVVVYEGLHNTRQHFIKEDLKDLFNDVKQLYVVPIYLAREDPNLPLLTPEDLIDLLSPKVQPHVQSAMLDNNLAEQIRQHAKQGDTVLCISAGGGNSLDEWLRKTFSSLET